MHILSNLTPSVAKAIGVPMIKPLDEFIQNGNENDFISFTHYNFFYSYPAFGQPWPDGKECEYHDVDTRCHVCKSRPERNFAGVGTLYLLNNGIGNADILIRSNGIKKRVPNTSRHSRMIILCKEHTKSYFPWQKNQKPKVVQLKLF